MQRISSGISSPPTGYILYQAAYKSKLQIWAMSLPPSFLQSTELISDAGRALMSDDSFFLFTFLTFLKNKLLFRQYIYMLFAGREVRIGKNCARGLEYDPRPQASRPRAQFFPIRTDLGRQTTYLFFSSVECFVISFCVEFSLQPFSNLVCACV